MSPVDKARVAEVLVRRSDKAEYGSGYRIASRLVLTADHLVGDEAEDVVCSVLLGGRDDQYPATRLWRSPTQDLALLHLDEPVPDRVPAAVFGRLPDGAGSVPFASVGFPAFALRPEAEGREGLRRRESKQVTGFVQLGSNMKSGLLDLTFTTTPPREPARGMPDPWLGMSGAALFAEDSGTLIAVQAQRLPAAGTNSAEAEPIATALADPEFCAALARHGVPSWTVPVSLPHEDEQGPLRAVISQGELIDGLPDFKKNLTPDRLAFVSPGSEHPAEPENLFVRLVNARDTGVLLVGAAGTGKTRTCLEVGRLALEACWRVLHVVPGEEESVTAKIAQEVFAEPTPVLVVVDYLNEAQLDLTALRRQLLPEARRRHVHVALLASVRPGWLRLKKSNSPLLHELFEEVELRQDDDFQQLVATNALTTLAPTAIRRLGMDRMLAICGRRPIVALLVAREMEHRIEAKLSLPETAGLREGGELPVWLVSRLHEDELTVPGRTSIYTPARASHVLVAAAAAAAACPQPRTPVMAAARAALAEAMANGEAVADVPDAEAVVTTLVSLGWLETDSEGVLSVAHDIVADQFMESVLLPERDAAPDAAGSYAMLAGCLTGPRTVGRFAVNVTRLVNDMALVDRAGPVTAVLNDWFVDHAGTIGRIMRENSNIGSYALGAVCSESPWSAAAVRCWEQIVGPWLADFGTDVNARHLLYRGLRYLPDDSARRLGRTALGWLRFHGQTDQAKFVLRPLLSRHILGAGDARQAITTALAWLEPDDRIAQQDAQFVLSPLLDRTDLTEDDARQAVTTALAWLDTDNHKSNIDAQYVLNTLLDRTDLTEDDARQAVTTALAWLDTDDHITTAQAGYVLDPLLEHTDLTPPQVRQAVTASFAWFGTDDRGTHLDAQYVLNSLLSRPDLTHDEACRIITTALAWLDTDSHATALEAKFVLDPLLDRAELAPGETGRVIAAALAWLAIGDHAAGTGAEFVLEALLRRLPIDEVPAEVTGFIEAWLDARMPTPDFLFMSKWVLRKRIMSPKIFRALLSWVHANPDHEDVVPRMAAAAPLVGPHVTSWASTRDWFRAVELCLDHSELRGAASNPNGILDVLMCQLAIGFRTGVGAAWADDCIQRWIALPFSMNAAVYRPLVTIVARCRAMALSGRFTGAEARELAERLRRWASEWPDDERRAEALHLIDTQMLPGSDTIRGQRPAAVPEPRPGSSDDRAPLAPAPWRAGTADRAQTAASPGESS
ncbi:trypsin-like peptidase domain-containing protein [Streptomyces sp. NPDC087901]|uniref:trypsin-like peptidase domain-containing protein n=1 Tax=Streptomyces sp. NPDC087901 TaxID=3365818 RepID=UPI0037F763FB